MNYTYIQSFSQAIAQNRMLESVVERMDFPKNLWQKPLAEVCQNTDYSEDLALAILRAFDEQEKFPTDALLKFPIESILHYLKATHRYYLEKKLPEIEQTFLNLVFDYKTTHPELVRLSSLFIDYKNELTHHIFDEETKLFPYIDFLIKANDSKSYRTINNYRFINYSLQHFEESHEDVEKSLTNIQHLIFKYAPKNSGALPFSIFLTQMDFFEKDLNRHGMMEDLVLIPLAQILENNRFN